MAETNLLNQASVSGNYGESSTPVTFASNEVNTVIVQGLTVTKSADKAYWVDGPLTYTIVVTNNSGSTLSSGSLTDTLNDTLVEFSNDYGLYINDSKSTNFTIESGLLTVTLPEIADSSTVTVRFQVLRKS